MRCLLLQWIQRVMMVAKGHQIRASLLHHPRLTPAQQLGSLALRYVCPLASLSPTNFCRFRRRAKAEITVSGGCQVRDTALARLEAVLFLAREPLNCRKLSQYANLADGTEARTLVGRLNELYDRAGRAFRVQEVAGGMQLLTRSMFSSWLRRLQHVPPESRLSAPAMETLAVVAYRQPVLRAEVEAVRGVGCGEILRQLMDRNLVRVAGRSDELGRPFLYGTTKRFLQLFGLRIIDELPRVEAFHLVERPAESADERPVIADRTSGEQNSTKSGDQQEERKSQVTATKQMFTHSVRMPNSTSTAPPLGQQPAHVQGAIDWDDGNGEDGKIEDDEKDAEDLDDDFDDQEWKEVDDDDDDDDEEDDDDDDFDDDFDDDDWEEVDGEGDEEESSDDIDDDDDDDFDDEHGKKD